MRKKIKFMALAIGVAMAVNGCGNHGKAGNIKDYSEQTTVAGGEQQSSATEKTDTTKNSENESEDLKQYGAEEFYNTEKGRYYINDVDEDEYRTIRYIDYNACKEVYLCNKLNCKHNNKECTAVLDVTGDAFLFGDEKYLYLLTTPYDSSGSMEISEISVEGENAGIVMNTNEEAPAIYRMEQDGSNREKIFEFESGTIAEQTVLGDGKYLYLITKKVKSETKENKTYNSSYDRKLVRVDLDKGATEEVMDLGSEQKVMGVNGRNVIVSEDDFGREISAEEQQDDDTYKELYDDSQCVISAINIDTKEITKLKEIKNSKDKLHREQIWGDKLYSTYEGEKSVGILDLKSGEEQKLKVDDSYDIEEILSVKNGDDVIVAVRYSDMGKEGGHHYYLIDTKTGEVTESTLQNRYKWPITIEAQTEDLLYVNNDYKTDTEYVAWAGVDQDYISETEYSVISKKNYLANKPNYKKVKLLNGGKVSDE